MTFAGPLPVFVMGCRIYVNVFLEAVDMELLYCGSNRVEVHVNFEVAARICVLN